jgi:hypothetical protein
MPPTTPQAFTPVAYGWNATATTATGLTLDDQSQSFTLPFTFRFYGTDYTSVNVSSNGFLNFGTGSNASSPVAIPNAAAPNALVAGLWRDLLPDTSCTGSGGACITYSSSPTQFVVSYNNVKNYDSAGRQTFQIILNSNGSIVYQYATVTNDVSTIIGVENSAGTSGSAYTVLPTDGMAIKITP